MRLTLVLPCLIASCAGPRPPAKIESPEGVIYARNDEMAQQCLAKVREFRPQIARILGDHPGPSEIQLRPWFSGCAYVDTGLIIVHETDTWTRTLAHELVHVHADGAWDTLPEAIAEALCDYFAHSLSGDVTYEGGPPTMAEVERALTTKEWMKNANLDVLSDAYWILGQIGLDRLRELTLRAEREGQATIPREWFLELLPGTAWEPLKVDLNEFLGLD